MPFDPLGKGFLTGTVDAVDEFRPTTTSVPRSRGSSRRPPSTTSPSSTAPRVAERPGATPAQVALAWLLAQKPWIVPIPGTRKINRLEENIGAADVELSADELSEIEQAASKIEFEGGRYPDALERQTNL